MNVNYKTMLLCAVIGASVQTAHGMDEEKIRQIKKTVEQDIKIIHLLKNQDDFDAADKNEIAQLAAGTNDLGVMSEILSRAYAGWESYFEIKKECRTEGVVEFSEELDIMVKRAVHKEFEEIVSKIVAFDTAAGITPIMNDEGMAWGLQAGVLAKEIKTALAKYQANQNNNQ